MNFPVSYVMHSKHALFYHYYTTLVSVFQETCVSRCRNVKAFWVLLQQGTKEMAAVTDGAFNARKSFAPTCSQIATASIPSYQLISTQFTAGQMPFWTPNGQYDAPDVIATVTQSLTRSIITQSINQIRLARIPDCLFS